MTHAAFTHKFIRIFAAISLFITFCLLLSPIARAENDGDCVYALYTEEGGYLTSRAGEMFVGDEYISRDDLFYRIVQVDHQNRSAEARCLGSAVQDDGAAAVFRAFAEKAENADESRLICMYSTHSDESYVPDDGASSKWKDAGIYDVGNALKQSLEKRGIKTVYSDETFLPHDAGAYRRSRSTAEELLKKQPDALFDVHRDAISADQYETTVDGEEASKIRLFVGRSNPNFAYNKAFAQQIKAAADEKYPDLIKDIYIGKGNYNQELSGNALLLEMGTHEIDKEKAMRSTEYLADVVETVLYGGSAKAAEQETRKTRAASAGIFIAIGAAVLGAVVYALAATGKLSGMREKLRRGVSEITGGLAGKRPGGKE